MGRRDQDMVLWEPLSQCTDQKGLLADLPILGKSEKKKKRFKRHLDYTGRKSIY